MAGIVFAVLPSFKLYIVIVAFFGVYNNNELWDMIWMTYVIKLGVAVLDTPLIYLIVWKLKEIEKENLRRND